MTSRDRLCRLPVFWLLLFLLATVQAFCLDNTIRTGSGLVAGTGTDIRVFKGIPYAAPPLGDLRWKPPQPAQPWQGVRQAAEFGAACPQAANTPPRRDEDCLTLNIWTPAKTPKAKLPVMVWIYGGAFITGGSALPSYDGEALARQGVVAVSINYRLGLLGFLAHPALTKESPHASSGNYGLLDQIAALQWVQRNIAAFGGNSKNVTIFGESAGASSVCFLLISPLAKGLFQRAIAESPGSVALGRRSGGTESLEAADASLGADLSALRAMSVERLMELRKGRARLPSEWPSVDGWVIPDNPRDLFESGRFARVPFMIGTNRDEGTMFIGPPLFPELAAVRTVAAYREYVKQRFPQSFDDAWALYPVASDADVAPVLAQAMGDALFQQGARFMARAVAQRGGKAYSYYFTRLSPLGRRRGMGVAHAAEIPYVFGNLSRPQLKPDPSLPEPFEETDRALSKAMSAAWVRFAKAGNPNGGGLPAWPAVNVKEPQYLEFGEKIQVGQWDEERRKRLDFLEAYSDRLRAGRK